MENETVSKNFIEQMIDKDIEEGYCHEVHTRFPPEPNGYLHIGHAKSILLNYGLAQKYGGKFNLRFDDTNPTKEKTEFVEAIQSDIEWLGADWEGRLFFASDYFEQMYEGAVKLIKKGKAYVSDLSAEQIREYRGTLTEPGKEDPYSTRSVEENLALFESLIGDGYLYTQETGTILMSRAEEGETLAGGDIVFAYSNPEKITVSVAVSQDSIAQLSVGESAMVMISDYGNYNGVIESIDPVSSSDSYSNLWHGCR